MKTELTEENFYDVSRSFYDMVFMDDVEFADDIARIISIKKLFNRYRSTNELKQRLILNHLIALFNMFDEHTSAMLFMKLDRDQWPVLKTFLVFMNRMPECIEYEHMTVRNGDIDTDDNAYKILKEELIRWN